MSMYYQSSVNLVAWIGVFGTYDPGTNGGIVGSVVYDVIRNELDATISLQLKVSTQAFLA